MGRFYFGQICGKFWVGIQDSYDAKHFGVDAQDVLYFYACYCKLSKDDLQQLNTDEPKIFCKECFSSYIEHMNAIEENRKDEESGEYDFIDEDSPKNDDLSWFISDNEVLFEFNEKHTIKVRNKIKLLEDLVEEYLLEYKIIDNDANDANNANNANNDNNSNINKNKYNENGITYEYKNSENLSREKIELVARLCLGKQILYCLEKYKECSFFAEF